MGRYCLVAGRFAKALVGEELHIREFHVTATTATIAVANAEGKPVCIPHEGCTIELISVAPGLAQHPVLAGLRAGQTARYQIVGTGRTEKDVVTLKDGKTVDLRRLEGCTFQITEETPA